MATFYVLLTLTNLIYLNKINWWHVCNFWFHFFGFNVFDYLKIIFLEMPLLSRKSLWNKKLNEPIKSLPKKIIFLDKDLRYFVGICFCREEGNLCIFQENLFLRLRAFYRFLTVYFCKNSVFEYIRILSWFEAKKIQIFRYWKF